MDRIDILKSFISRSPGDHFSRHALALEYIKAGDDVSAREQFEWILAADPGYIGSYYHLGRLLEREGRLQEALVQYQRAAETDPSAQYYRELVQNIEARLALSTTIAQG